MLKYSLPRMFFHLPYTFNSSSSLKLGTGPTSPTKPFPPPATSGYIPSSELAFLILPIFQFILSLIQSIFVYLSNSYVVLGLESQDRWFKRADEKDQLKAHFSTVC